MDLTHRDDVVLQLRGIQVSYPGIRALDWAADDELCVRAGTVHGLLGENGAGKSTLFRVISGGTVSDAGRMRLLGDEYRPHSVPDAHHHGVELVLQEPGLVPSLTVAENFLLGRSSLQSDAAAGCVVPGRARRIVSEGLARVAPHVSPHVRAGELCLEDQKLVELARALHFRPRVLLVDELSACLGRRGLDILFRVLDEERRAGTAVLYISHYLDEVATVCDVVTVLKDGQLVETLPATTDHDRLGSLMVGRPTSALFPARTPPATQQAQVLEADALSLPGAFADVSLTVRRGEVVGIAGLVGCGSAELARALFGMARPASGSMRLAGTSYRPRGPREAIGLGVGYVPPDRDREGLLLRAPIAANLALTALRRRSRLGVHLGSHDNRIARDLIGRVGIKCRGPRDLPHGLSGGNRQKVVLAKWLVDQPTLLVLHNPTRGIDVGAKAEIYARIREVATTGTAVLLVSDELPELIGLSDRLLVMRRGRVTHHTTSTEASEDSLLAHMI
jgi:ribose transport system ATP-binding protein